jgi:hypothetical protein
MKQGSGKIIKMGSFVDVFNFFVDGANNIFF